MWRNFNVSSNHAVAMQQTATNIDFHHEVFIFHKRNWCSLIDNYCRHKTPCGIRKLTVAFVSKIGVFSRFSWSLDFGAKMAEFPLPVLQIWRSRKWVAIQIQLMNINVSEYKYYCLQLIPKFGDMCDRQNWRLHPTVRRHFEFPMERHLRCSRTCVLTTSTCILNSRSMIGLQMCVPWCTAK